MACPVDPDMTTVAATNAKWYGAPGPLYCGPRSLYPTTGYWDFEYECNKPSADPPEFCSVYEGQQAGGEVKDSPVANRNGRTDVEGCCWWGRGTIQTTGPCNYGRLNYFLGKRAADEGRPSRFPTVDICSDPGVICSSQEFPELKWVAGLFYWIDSVQTYSAGGWVYLKELHKFVDGGKVDTSFIDAVSGIVNRGCHNPPCATGSVDGGPERAENFQKVLDAMDVVPTAMPPTTSVVPTSAGPVVAPTSDSPVALSQSTTTTSPVANPSNDLSTESPSLQAIQSPSPTEMPEVRFCALLV